MISVLFLVCISLSKGQSQHSFNKIKGVSFSGPEHSGLDIQTFNDIVDVNAEWVTFVPEVVLNRATLKLRPDAENHYWGRTLEGNIAGIKLAKEAGLKIMLKPQMILDRFSSPSGIFSDLIKLEDLGGMIVADKSNGVSWRGYFKPDNTKDWLIWEKSYKAYILNLARVAEEMEIEIFCVGTELRESVEHRSAFWVELIAEVRKIYSGSVIYSANWDDYKEVTFWDQLDYIGVNSYFPVSLLSTPSVKGVTRNWKYFKKRLKKFSKKHKKQIIFTEFGYRNVSFAGLRPWVHDDGQSKSNDQSQVNLYEAFFEAFWGEEWVLGGFSWNWDALVKYKGNTDFSVQNKPAQKILENWFGS